MTSVRWGTKDQKFQRSGGQDVEIEGQKSDEKKPSCFFQNSAAGGYIHYLVPLIDVYG